MRSKDMRSRREELERVGVGQGGEGGEGWWEEGKVDFAMAWVGGGEGEGRGHCPSGNG